MILPINSLLCCVRSDIDSQCIASLRVLGSNKDTRLEISNTCLLCALDFNFCLKDSYSKLDGRVPCFEILDSTQKEPLVTRNMGGRLETRRASLALATAFGSIAAAAERLPGDSLEFNYTTHKLPIEAIRDCKHGFDHFAYCIWSCMDCRLEYDSAGSGYNHRVADLIHTAYDSGITLFDLADQYSLRQGGGYFWRSSKTLPRPSQQDRHSIKVRNCVSE